MDQKTLDAYDKGAKSIIENHLKRTPTRLYELAENYFVNHGLTADIGCGSGRDCDYFSDRMGLKVTGFDGSDGMLAEAKRLFPDIEFVKSTLPDLANIESESFDNVFSSATLMHIADDQVEKTIENMMRILKPCGRIVLSYRGTRDGNNGSDANRESDERLFYRHEPSDLKSLFEQYSGKVVLIESDRDESFQGIVWEHLVIIKE